MFLNLSFPYFLNAVDFSLPQGDLQSTLLAMRDCSYELSVALSAFGAITRGRTALTSECGSMLEEVGCSQLINVLMKIHVCQCF